ncbi:transposase family protein [Glutamicibacter sp. NPDC087344]|uniref:transposase family protein n=1 Tax=Glutamicibacter sp. NPDC087344 TaxID=3363994 RepID=UPI0037F80BC3
MSLLERQHDLPELGYGALTALRSGLIHALNTVPDPRRKQGQRYNNAWLLAITLCTIMCKQTSYRQMSRLAARLHNHGNGRIPEPSRFHRLLKVTDPIKLQQALSRWVTQRTTTSSGWFAEEISIGEKQLRSAIHEANPQGLSARGLHP